MKVMLGNEKYQEVMANGETVIHDMKKDSENTLVENHEILRKVTHDFDGNTGSTMINLETLKNINIELGQIAEDVRNTDSSSLTEMGMMFYGIDHKVMLLADLFHYTVKELEGNFEHTRIIKESYFDLIIRTKEQEDNLNGTPSHEYPFIPMEKLKEIKDE